MLWTKCLLELFLYETNDFFFFFLDMEASLTCLEKRDISQEITNLTLGEAAVVPMHHSWRGLKDS